MTRISSLAVSEKGEKYENNYVTFSLAFCLGSIGCNRHTEEVKTFNM
jgi:hypothetical protein